MCVSATKSYTNRNSLAISRHKYLKKSLIYILIAILFFGHMKVGVAAILNFFYFNLLVRNVYFGFTKLLQSNYIIAKMFSGLLIVTVNL